MNQDDAGFPKSEEAEQGNHEEECRHSQNDPVKHPVVSQCLERLEPSVPWLTRLRSGPPKDPVPLNGRRSDHSWPQENRILENLPGAVRQPDMLQRDRIPEAISYPERQPQRDRADEYDQTQIVPYSSRDRDCPTTSTSRALLQVLASLCCARERGWRKESSEYSWSYQP
jgi:hypothetical protein